MYKYFKIQINKMLLARQCANIKVLELLKYDDNT